MNTIPNNPVLVMTLNSPALGRRQQHPGASAAATIIISAASGLALTVVRCLCSCHLNHQRRLGLALTVVRCFCSCHLNHQRAALVTRRVNNLSHGPGCPSVFAQHGQMPLFTAEGLRRQGRRMYGGSERHWGWLGGLFSLVVFGVASSTLLPRTSPLVSSFLH